MIAAAGITNCGGKQENEDTVRILNKGNGACVVVADGLGGHGGGSIASSSAADCMLKFYQSGHLESKEDFAEAVSSADGEVMACQSQECEMKTTLVTLVVDEEKASWAHVGDSRLYHFVDSRIVYQTMDHSVSQMAVLMNEITPDQIRFHVDRCKVLRALGSDNAEPDIVTDVPVGEHFHVFLLCSDGFWEYIYEQEMEAMLSNSTTPEMWLEQMEQLLLQRVPEDNDNYSAAAVFVCR